VAARTFAVAVKFNQAWCKGAALRWPQPSVCGTRANARTSGAASVFCNATAGRSFSCSIPVRRSLSRSSAMPAAASLGLDVGLLIGRRR
jgi:hypothetical protein